VTPTMGPMESGRVVISEADLWRPLEQRSFALRTENRRRLDSRRARAYALDRALLAVPTGVAVTAFGEGGWLVALALTLAYFFTWESLTGQTAGKWLMGLRVVRLDGGPLNIAAVATRNVLLLVDQVLGVFFIVATRKRQRLGDLVGGTVVTEAADHRHVPARERFRTAILAGYPIAWIGAAVVMAVLTAANADHARYLRTANSTCVSARDALRANPHAGVAELHAAVVDVERTLRVLDPPADLRPAHARLVTAIHRERALLGQAVGLRGAALAQVAARYRAMAERDARQARADGYPACT
jgi:uncharacterized RDD family membrane protein YckC